MNAFFFLSAGTGFLNGKNVKGLALWRCRHTHSNSGGVCSPQTLDLWPPSHVKFTFFSNLSFVIFIADDLRLDESKVFF